jgi:hypothetical protein
MLPVKKRQKQNLKRGLVISAIVLVVIIVSFVLMMILKAPAGNLDVVFNIDVGVQAQSIQMDPSGSPIFIGGPEGEFKILSGNGSEIAHISMGKPVLDIKIDPHEKIVIVRTLLRLTTYTYDGKLAWELRVKDYLPEKIQMLPRGRVGVYLRSGRGDEPMVGVYDVATGIAEKSMLLSVQETDINPTFMPDGESIVFEIIPGMISEVALKEGLPIIWKAHLDTYDNRFTRIEPVITNSNLVVCYFKLDSEPGMLNESFREVFAFDPSTIQASEDGDETATPELAPLWKKRVDGEIIIFTANPSQDIILIQAADITILNRSGEVLVTESTNTQFYFCSLGDSRYMSSYFLEGSSDATLQVLLTAKGIGREGILWRRTETMTNNILPVVTPDCEKLLMVLPETKHIMLLKTSY